MKTSMVLPLIKFYDTIAHLKLDLKLFIKMIQTLHFKSFHLKVCYKATFKISNCLNVWFESSKVKFFYVTFPDLY